MPTVPYNPVPQVEQTGAGRVPQVQISGISASAFGGDVAEGFGALGKTLDNVGDEWFKRAQALQKLNNESEAREAEAAFTIAAGDLSAKYNALQGKDAVMGREAYVQSLRDLRASHIEGMSNSETKRLFSESSLGTMSRLTLYSATHAATENRKYVSGAATASAAAAVDAVAQTPDDEDAVKIARDKSKQAVRIQAAVNGWGVEQASQADKEAQSGITFTQITSQADKDPFGAEATLERNRAEMTAADIAKAEALIKSRQTQVGSRNIESIVNSDFRDPNRDATRPEKSIGERTDEARKLAERQRPGDIEYADQAVARVTAGYSRRKAEIREADLNNSYIVNGAVIGEQNVLPTNLDELRAISPAVSKAYDDLPPERKRAVNKGMALNAKGDVPESATTVREVLAQRGLALSDNPDDREKFLYTDVMSLNIPLKDRRTLGMLQQKLKEGVGDPRVATAYRQLADAGIAPTADRSSKEDVQIFRGALQEALDLWQQDHKGQRPDLKAIKEIGSRITQTAADPERWSFGIGMDKVPMYKFNVPDQFKKIATDEALGQGRGEPSPEELQRLYLRYRYRELNAPKAKPQP